MLSQNLVNEVSYRKNIILINFNEIMTRDNEDKHSYLNKENYYLDINSVNKYLEDIDTIDEINGGTSIKISLKGKVVNRITKIHLGYSTTKDIKYIESADGNIQDCSYCFMIGEEVEAFNLFNNSKAIVLDDYTLRVIYYGRNKLDIIRNIESDIDSLLQDFSVTILNSQYAKNPVNPKSIIYEANDSCIFKFSYPVFSGYSGVNGKLSIVSSPKSKDIYGKAITGEISVGVIINPKSAILESFKVNSNNEDGIVEFTLTFSEDIKIFDYNDFLINYNGVRYKIGLTKKVDSRRWMIYSYIPNFNQNSSASIYTNVSLESIRTRDINLNRVFIEIPVCEVPFSASAINWNHSNTIDNSKVWIYYEDSLKLQSVSANNYKQLESGEAIIICGDEVSVSGGMGDSDLILDFTTINYGKIIFKHKNGEGNILNSPQLQLEEIGLKYVYKKNRLNLSFSRENNGDISIDSISSIEYKANRGIQNSKDIYINENKKLSLKVARIIPVEGNENPFDNKEIQEGNTMITIISSQGNNGIPLVYGGNSMAESVTINGDITITIEERRKMVEVIIQNLIIDGDILIDNSGSLEECGINIENISGRGVIYIKGGNLRLASNIDGLDIEIV